MASSLNKDHHPLPLPAAAARSSSDRDDQLTVAVHCATVDRPGWLVSRLTPSADEDPVSRSWSHSPEPDELVGEEGPAESDLEHDDDDADEALSDADLDSDDMPPLTFASYDS